MTESATRVADAEIALITEHLDVDEPDLAPSVG